MLKFKKVDVECYKCSYKSKLEDYSYKYRRVSHADSDDFLQIICPECNYTFRMQPYNGGTNV